jgi:predicted DNA-binding transcriptional regulator AlpA
MEKKPKGRPQKTIEALVWRGIIPETWKEDILNLGREGKNKIHYANYLGITRNTLYKIMDRDPDFLHTIKLALEYSQEWWINKVRDSFEKETSGKVNSQLWRYMMENTFRQDWKLEQSIDITSGGDKINPDNKIIVDIVLPKKEDEDTSD